MVAKSTVTKSPIVKSTAGLNKLSSAMHFFLLCILSSSTRIFFARMVDTLQDTATASKNCRQNEVGETSILPAVVNYKDQC